MNKWTLTILGACFGICAAREPFKPFEGSLPFLVYYTSRYRGLCVGTLVSRMVVMSAAVCVTNPISEIPDKRPINVITAATYRHPRRGIRVQVTKLLLPKLPKNVPNRAFLLQKSPVFMILKRKVPDVLAEIPLRALDVDWKGEEVLTLQEECLMPGWHFFYRGDKIYPVHKFLLQRNVRVQFLDIVKTHLWCDTLSLKFEKSLDNLGFEGFVDREAQLCIRDPDKNAQPCHGMYGAPLICKARAVAMLMAPDAQWTNCTGFSNIVHLLSADYMTEFMECVSKLFVSDIQVDWDAMKNAIWKGHEETYDYIPSLYDRVVGGSSSSSEEL